MSQTQALLRDYFACMRRDLPIRDWVIRARGLENIRGYASLGSVYELRPSIYVWLALMLL